VTIVQRIHGLTKDKGWSSYRLANESGISQSTVSNLLSRGTYPSLFTLERICQALDISMAGFFAGCEVEDKDEANELGHMVELCLHLPKNKRKKVIKILEEAAASPKN
jgi:transcriptional regulator with XRE-family HTH domain